MRAPRSMYPLYRGLRLQAPSLPAACRLAGLVAGLCWAALLTVAAPVFAQQCYTVADEVSDKLFLVDFSTNPATQTPIGLTGTSRLEAMAIAPSGVLYAFEEESTTPRKARLGTLNTSTGAFTPRANYVGTIRGTQGGTPVTLTVDDVDGMAYDFLSGVWYGAMRTDDGVIGTGKPDLLFTFDPVTGLAIPDAFGPGVDFVEIEKVVPDYHDIDDLSFNPFTNRLYGVANNSGYTSGTYIVEINKTTGAVTNLGEAFIDGNPGSPLLDVEGFDIDLNGRVVAVVGLTHPNQHVYELTNLGSGTITATLIATLNADPNAHDFESWGCLKYASGTGFIGDRLFEDVDDDGIDDAEPGVSSVTVRLRYAGADGIPGNNDDITFTTTTTGSGAYGFSDLGAGTYRVDVDEATLPANARLTTGNEPLTVALGTGQNYNTADFGYAFDLLTKTSNAAGALTPGQTLTYTVQVFNTTGASMTGVAVADNLPAGVTYVPATTQITTLTPSAGNARDDFNAVSYGNNNGSFNWNGDWTEIADDGNISGGDIRVVTDLSASRLQIKKQDNGAYRAVNLAGATAATLSFIYRRSDTNAATKITLIEVSSNGGTNWTTIGQIIGDATDASYQSASYDISAYATANTVIRFLNNSANDKTVFFDDVDVSATFLTQQVTAGGPPPTLTSGQTLADGATMTITFDVTVDTPPVSSSITNTATMTSNQTAAEQTSVVDAVADGDADGDGIPNSVEDANGNGLYTDDDADGDGRPNYLDIDSDNDGLTDQTEAGPTPTSPRHADGDALPDYLDVDSDADGIPDNVEAQSSLGFTPPSASFTDVDSDGLDDAYDADTTSPNPTLSAGLTPYDYDGDTTPDYRDGDSDDDGSTDAQEGHDYIHDGTPEYTPAGADSDGDGLDDGFEGEFAGSYMPGQAYNPNNGVTATLSQLPKTDDPDVNFRNSAVLPVELTSFTAVRDGSDVLLSWQTASETNNAYFEIQGLSKNGGDDWQVIGRAEGHGTTEQPQAYRHRVTDLPPGTYAFRLKQVDFDGTFAYSPEVEVDVEMNERFVVAPAYPNPFNPEARVRFAVRQGQRVRVEMYDVAGRRVGVFYAGEVAAGHAQQVVIDGAGLPSGLYLVRVLGEAFVHTQTVMLVK